MARLDGIRKQLEQKIVRVADVVAREVEMELRSGAPVDSGELRSLITAQVRATVSGARVTFDSRAPYARYVREHREQWDQIMRGLPDRVERVWRGVR